MARNNASRRNANQKSVLGTAVRNASVFTLKNAAKVVMAMLVITLIACAKEQLSKPASQVKSLNDSIEVLVEHYSSSLRTLTVSATPKDTLIKSDVNFAHTAVMQYGDEAGMRYDLTLNPSAYAYVRQSKDRMDVSSELEIPTTLVKSEVIEDKPFNNGTTLGRDKHVRNTFADGNVDDIYFGYRYLAIISGGDTLATPHIVFNELKLDSIHIEKFGEQTALDKPHKLTHHYSLSFTTKGVSNRETTSTVVMRPWRVKSITDVEQVKTGEPSYQINWVGCPITKLNLVQSTPTNKGVVTVTETFDVTFNVTVPEAREQASLDSLFSKTSKGELKYAAIGDTVKHVNGFQSLNYAGGYTSRNKGLENGSNVETTATITASMPVKFSNKWGSVDIKPLEPTFEEGGFVVTSVSQDADYHMFKTVNTIIPHLGDCTMDALDEVVKIKVAKDKAEIWVDSVFVKKGNGDKYTIDATFYGSKGSKREMTWTYDGRHSASAKNFGEKITSSLNWNASALKDNGTSKENDKKEFTPDTYFEATYTATEKISNASNGAESGVFTFSETHPIVTFVHGETKIEFDERPVVLTAQAPVPAANYNVVVRDGVSYKGYTYNMTAGVVFDGEAEGDVVSQGLLLMVADEVGETSYKDEYVWNGNVLTATVTKTTPHTFADDEVETYTKAVTVSMGDLSDDKVYAENVNFTVTPSNSEKSDDDKDGVWTITKRVRNYTYTVSNGSASRQMTNEVVDYVLVFNDGTHSHTFDGKLNVSNADNFGNSYADGDFTVTPLTTTVTAVATGNGAPTLTTKGVTSIYVENKKEITWKLTYTVDEVDGGNVYVDLTFQRLINGQVNKTWKHWGLGGMFGQYKPDVEGIWVTNTKFRDNYSTTEHATDPSVYDLGDEKAYTLDNISKIEDHFSVLFDANADADGNTTREVAGHVNRWSYRYTAVDKEYNHSESIDLVVTTKTTVHNVENGVYTRTIEYQLNGVTVATQTGTVKVTVE
jgi:hypothetical protein